MNSSNNKKKIEELLNSAIAEGIFPGASYTVWRGKHAERGSVGRRTYCPESPKMKMDDVFDLASVSKVVSTTTLMMQAVHQGKISLDQRVCEVVTGFEENGKGEITFRNLMVHNSGLIAFRPFQQSCQNANQVLSKIVQEKLIYPTGSKMVYSDLNMILVAKSLELIFGKSLSELFRERVAQPLGLKKTGYFDAKGSTTLTPLTHEDCVPTERIEDWRIKLRQDRLGIHGSALRYGPMPDYIQGEVHDPAATAMEGVAGHAGLFSTVADLEKFMRAFSSKESKLVPFEVMKSWTHKQSDLSSRALGWDTKSPSGSSAGSKFGPVSFGHTGYTGTSIWRDPESDLNAILLTNRVHPTSQNTKIIGFRAIFHDLVASVV
jgi:CubicO group peptidase (beta-lactamase class C family)